VTEPRGVRDAVAKPLSRWAARIVGAFPLVWRTTENKDDNLYLIECAY
jgi:hypothetical protein